MSETASASEAIESGGEMPKVAYLVPLLVGFGFVVWGLAASRWGWRFDPTDRVLFGAKGIETFYGFTYLLLMGSIITVMGGTGIYLFDELFISEIKFPKQYGAAQLRWAFLLCIVAVTLMGIFLGWGIFSVGDKSDNIVRGISDHASMENFNLFVRLHDYLTISVFLVFIAVDWLSYSAAKMVCDNVPDRPKLVKKYGEQFNQLLKRAGFMKRLSLAQILLVDFAVVAGALVNLGIHMFIFHHPKYVGHDAELYIGGVTAGFLAAHIIVSQIVFIMLNIRGEKLFHAD